MVGLCADYSIYMISRSLRLDYNTLKRCVSYSNPASFPESVTLYKTIFSAKYINFILSSRSVEKGRSLEKVQSKDEDRCKE